MATDFIAQISNSIKKNTCQAFDPLMLIEEKAAGIIPGAHRLNTSCASPSYVYVSGSHGNKFLCDFHYVLEMSAEKSWSLEQYEKVFAFVYSELSDIFYTFADAPEERPNRPEGLSCWCGVDAYVFHRDRYSLKIEASFCNFHHRKHYYRSLSNGIDLYEKFIIDDYRKQMKDFSIEAEFNQIGEI